MKFCRKCGAQLNDDAAFCPKCGTQVAMAQPVCENKVKEEQAEPQMNENISLEPAPQKKKTRILIIAIIAVAVLAICAVVFFVAAKKDKTAAVPESEIHAEIETYDKTEAEITESEEKDSEVLTEFENNAEAKTEAEKPAESDNSEETQISEDEFVGSWVEPIAGRWGITIEKDGDKYIVTEEGSSSYKSGDSSKMTCYVDEKGLHYNDGTSTIYQYDDSGNYAELVEYEDAVGNLTLSEDESALDLYGDNIVGVLAKVDENSGNSGKYLIWTQEPVEYLSQEYVLWYSSDLLLNDMDTSILNEDEMRIARNEIYARHGRKFDSEDLQSYFNSCSWYSGSIDSDAFDDNSLSEIEKTNIKFLGGMENARETSVCVVDNAYVFSSSQLDEINEWNRFSLLGDNQTSFLIITNYGTNGQSDTDYMRNVTKEKYQVGAIYADAAALFIDTMNMRVTFQTYGGMNNIISNSDRNYIVQYFIDTYNSNHDYKTAVEHIFYTLEDYFREGGF